MEFFKSVLRAFGLLEPAKVDFISELPLEVSQLILRKLDSESLLSVAQVSRNWLNVCRSDKILKQTARRHKRAVWRQMRVGMLETSSSAKSRAKTSRKLKELKKLERNIPVKTFVAAAVFGAPVSRRIKPTKTITARDTAVGRLGKGKGIRM